MRFVDYIKDKLINIYIYLFAFVLIILLLFCFNVNMIIILYITVILFFSFLFNIFYDYWRKSKYYTNIYNSLKKLDKKFLITEVIDVPNFIEGKFLVDFLYDIDKSMIEEINKYKYSSEEFKEYLELWCHEVKTPIATSKLIIDNNKNEITESLSEEIEKINDYIEQILYYSRSGVVENDYIIADVNIQNIVNKVIKKNKKDILIKRIKLEINMTESKVKTDQKWIEYIMNQIVVNSIKYSNNDGVIKIYTYENKNSIELKIEDSGIGIKSQDIKKLFSKGFTGINGRKISSATGMGLYLSKKLCDKLNINIKIDSKENKGTIVTLVFPISSMNIIR